VKLAVFVPSLDTGGLSSLAKELALAALLHEHQVMVVTLYSSASEPPKNLIVKNLKVSPPRFLFSKPLTGIFRTLRAYFLLIRFRPDFVICLDPSSSFVCMMCRYLGLRFKVFAFLSTPLRLLQNSDRAIIRHFYGHADRVVVPSIGSKLDIKALNEKAKITIIPNPYTNKSSMCAWPMREDKSVQTIQYLGRLSVEKEVRHILRIATANKDLHFRISGDGPERKSLESEIANLSLSNVELTGWLDPSTCLPSSAALILPSKLEAFGIVVIEAWLHGLPVIAWSGADGPNELISTNGGGDLVSDFEDLDEWAQKIRSLIHKPLSDSFIADILERYSSYKLIDEWLRS
jgi:glycosyltransferase involved in cell wall biosynthesis